MKNPENNLARRVLGMQIVAIVMPAAVAVFAGICLNQVSNNGPIGRVPAGDEWPIVSMIALAALGICIPLSLFVPNWMLRRALQQITAGTWKPPAEADPALYA